MKKLTDDQAALLNRLAAILDRQDPEQVEALEEPAADILNFEANLDGVLIEFDLSLKGAHQVTWKQDVYSAICRHYLVNQIFTRQDFLRRELDRLSRAHPKGATPELTINRVMQELRDEGYIEFINNAGNYRRIR